LVDAFRSKIEKIRSKFDAKGTIMCTTDLRQIIRPMSMNLYANYI